MYSEKFHREFRVKLHNLLIDELGDNHQDAMCVACSLMVESINILHQVPIKNGEEFEHKCRMVFERILNFYVGVMREENSPERK